MSSFAIEHRRGWVRWALGVVVGVVVLALLIARRGELAGASSRIATISVPFAVLAVLAEGGSLLSFALAQRRVLAVGKRLGLGGLFALTIANDEHDHEQREGRRESGDVRTRRQRDDDANEDHQAHRHRLGNHKSQNRPPGDR